MDNKTLANNEIHEDFDDSTLKLQALHRRLQESEALLKHVNQLTDSAYLALGRGDTQTCQRELGYVCVELSDYFCEEIH